SGGPVTHVASFPLSGGGGGSWNADGVVVFLAGGKLFSGPGDWRRADRGTPLTRPRRGRGPAATFCPAPPPISRPASGQRIDLSRVTRRWKGDRAGGVGLSRRTRAA